MNESVKSADIKSDPFVSERNFALDELERTGRDLAAAYVAVGRIQHLAEKQPCVINDRMVSVIDGFMEREEFAARRTAYFLYRKAGEALMLIVLNSLAPLIKRLALKVLRKLVRLKDGPVHRAAAEGLGFLPLDIKSPGGVEDLSVEPPYTQWWELMNIAGVQNGAELEMCGRSLLADLELGRVLVVKMARAGESAQSLHEEAAWMTRLQKEADGFPVSFHVPRPLKIDGSYVFRLKSGPDESNIPGLDPEKTAMAFTARAEYFHYPNDDSGGGLPDGPEFLKILSKNAWLLGRLGAGGMLHTAPIPLFHNRIQAGRRTDSGVYEWPRQGRLDQWLTSCRFPNLCKTGLRDFEHVLPFSGSARELYLHMGTHILSLVLVLGSYFRNRDPERVGLDEKGNPVDARDLFDEQLLLDSLEAIFKEYYNGFVGDEYSGGLPRDGRVLAEAVIREMGVDRHMEEILRVHDQQRMNRDQFVGFLVERGMPRKKAMRLKKDVRDVPIYTGPHLGDFNDVISLPELICFTATSVSLCVSGKYMAQNQDIAA